MKKVKNLPQLTMYYYEIALDKVIKDYNLKITKFNLAEFNLDANYDQSAGTVLKSNLPFMENNFVEMNCIDCYSSGKVLFNLEIKGTTFTIRSYKFSLLGSLKAHLGVQLQVFHIIFTLDKTGGLSSPEEGPNYLH